MFMSFPRNFRFCSKISLRKQPTFRDAHHWFPVKWRLRNKRRNSILMTCHFPLQIADANFPPGTTNQKHYPRLSSRSSDALSVWNFICARFAHVISQGNQWWRRRKMSAVGASQMGTNMASPLDRKKVFFSQNRFHCKAQTVWYYSYTDRFAFYVSIKSSINLSKIKYFSEYLA